MTSDDGGQCVADSLAAENPGCAHRGDGDNAMSVKCESSTGHAGIRDDEAQTSNCVQKMNPFHDTEHQLNCVFTKL